MKRDLLSAPVGNRLMAIPCAMICGLLMLSAPELLAQEAPAPDPAGESPGAETTPDSQQTPAPGTTQESGAESAKPDAPPAGDPQTQEPTQSGAAESDAAESDGRTSSDDEDRPRTRRRRNDISRNSGRFLDVFRPLAESTNPAMVRVKSGDDLIALGTIVDPAGFVLTKQSELRSPLTCELSDGQQLPARVYGVHEPTDLALLKIDVESVPVVRWSQGPQLEIGNWLVTVRGKDQKPGVGVVGVKERLIKPKSGFMGVNLTKNEAANLVGILNVSPDTPAERAGIKRGDLILEIEGQTFSEVDDVIKHVQGFAPGDEITLRMKRGDKEITLDVLLGDAESLNPLFERSNQQNTMGGNVLSKRRQDFPLAVQHDTLLKPEECGGPVVNIDGEVVGINIARQGRVSSLMLPTSLLLPIIAELKTGQLAPPLVNQTRIDEINMALQDLRNTINLSPVESESTEDSLQEHAEAEQDARDNLEKALRQLDEARDARLRAEIAMQNATSELEEARKKIERLEKELQELVSGTK